MELIINTTTCWRDMMDGVHENIEVRVSIVTVGVTLLELSVRCQNMYLLQCDSFFCMCPKPYWFSCTAYLGCAA